jgi:sulfate permease, SulP family
MPHLLTIRIDEALTYLNARWLEEFVLEQVAEHPALKHLILMCSAVNAIDASALESLEAINHRLADGGIKLHMSEVKGPVMDALKNAPLLDDLTGDVFLSQNDAFAKLIHDQAGLDALPEGNDLWLARGLI